MTTATMVIEHTTTSEAVAFVLEGNNIAATIAPQNLLFNQNMLFKGETYPHFDCFPILKREQHRQALVQAATSGNPKFFRGTDSSPHTRHSKESYCGCAGCYSTLHAIALSAEVLEIANALDKLEAFSSFYGPDFYQLPRNTEKITVPKTTWCISDEVPFSETDLLVLLWAGHEILW